MLIERQKSNSDRPYWRLVLMLKISAAPFRLSKCLSTTSTSNHHKTFLMINTNAPVAAV